MTLPSDKAMDQIRQSQSSAQSPRYTYYHAGPLFTLSDLHTNTLLARAINNISSGKFVPIVPQDLEQRDTSPHSIRDQDIRSLLACDLALFTYDGAELDSGTVVEYMMAKFADIPTVILRTDFRKAGDQGDSTYEQGGGDPWNLMSSFWPRTKRVVVDAMMGYKMGLARAMEQKNLSGREVENITTFAMGGGPAAIEAGEELLGATAENVVQAMEEVLTTPGTIPKESREHVYRWLALMPGFKSGGEEVNVTAMHDLLAQKEYKGLM